jgi:hypothetical protein
MELYLCQLPNIASGSGSYYRSSVERQKVMIKNDLKLVYKPRLQAPISTQLVHILTAPPTGRWTQRTIPSVRNYFRYRNPTRIAKIPDNNIFILDTTGQTWKVVIEVVTTTANGGM